MKETITWPDVAMTAVMGLVGVAILYIFVKYLL